MNSVLVAGGAGFIGSHLCDRLIKDGYSVICIDNLYTGSLDNIRHLRQKRFIFGEVDITNMPDEWKDYLNSDMTNIAAVFNCACPASPKHYQGNHAVDTTLTNVLGTKNLLDIAVGQGAKFIQLSTSEVYGDPDCEEQSEGYRGNVSCIGPRACYDEGKRCAESLCFDYLRQYGVDVKVVRIFNTYGPRMQADDGRVVSNFICQALGCEPLTVYGDGSQTRSFCYVDDLIDGLVKMMGSKEHGPINLGNPNEITVSELASRIIHLAASDSETVFKELPQDDPKRRRPDISKANEKLGWSPKVDLEEGLRKTIDYFASLDV